MENLTTDEDCIELTLPGGDLPLKAELRRRHANPTAKTTSPKQLVAEKSGDDRTLTAELTECGEYQLDVYESRDPESGLQHFRSYRISRVQNVEGEADEKSTKRKNKRRKESIDVVGLSKEEKEKREMAKAHS